MTTEARAARDDRNAADGPRAYLGRLEGLAQAVTEHGLRARLVTPPGRGPSLHGVNPDASAPGRGGEPDQSRPGRPRLRRARRSCPGAQPAMRGSPPRGASAHREARRPAKPLAPLVPRAAHPPP